MSYLYLSQIDLYMYAISQPEMKNVKPKYDSRHNVCILAKRGVITSCFGARIKAWRVHSSRSPAAACPDTARPQHETLYEIQIWTTIYKVLYNEACE